jgi:hypothetical protein
MSENFICKYLTLEIYVKIHVIFTTPSLFQEPRESEPYEKALMARIWSRFDSHYMKPLLTHARPSLMETLPGCCNPLARLLTTTEQITQVRTETERLHKFEISQRDKDSDCYSFPL